MSASDKFDFVQMIRRVFDNVSQSLKVTIQNLEVAMELSHTDGDSIYSYSAQTSAVATSGVAIVASSYKKIAVYSVLPVGLVLSASADGTTFIDIDITNATYILKDIAATHVKLTFSSGTVKYVLQA